ncbi:MAG: hypothetical protein KAG61_10830 [Bacteriovoracaceae bacterium]|nr:hypothetical protein [Bacteriovoracaceae bacterium]
MKILILLSILTFSTSCAQLLSHRSYMSQMNSHDQSLFTPSEDFQVIAGDTGNVGRSKEDIAKRTPATSKQQKRNLYSSSIANELSEKERSIQGDERAFYLRYKSRIGSTSDKIYYLDLTPRERRQYLSEIGIIKRKSRFSRGRNIASVAFGDMSLEQPIQMGMSKGDVAGTWGSPAQVDFAGNPNNQNERWSFWRNGKTNFVYFESGRVSGWELQ